MDAIDREDFDQPLAYINVGLKRTNHLMMNRHVESVQHLGLLLLLLKVLEHCHVSEVKHFALFAAKDEIHPFNNDCAVNLVGLFVFRRMHRVLFDFWSEMRRGKVLLYHDVL